MAMSNALRSSSFQFHAEGLPVDTLCVYRIKGREQISQPFCFEVTLIAESRTLDLHARIGQPATLTIKGLSQLGIAYYREIHGRIERFMQLSGGNRYSQYQATLSPTLFPLGYTRNSRIFRQLSTVEIVEKVLSDAHISKEQIQTFLHSQYAKRDFCVQYQESDLAFINRLLEEEGIFYFFRHKDGKDIIVLGDGSHAFEAVPNANHIAYRDHPHRYEEVIHSLHSEARFRPGSTVLRDFRFKHPNLDMEAHQTASDFANYQVYYFPGEYVEPEFGQRLAKIRHEEIQCERSLIAAKSTCPAFLPGHAFELAGSWRHDLSRSYLLLEVMHEGVEPQVLGEEHVGVAEQQYKNSILCISSDVTYRPPRVTPKPCILGIQSAVVVGPSSEEIHCDEHGRIKVQFHWDRQGKQNDESSCWIRVSQPWGGVGYGGMFIPRIGQEVLVQFLEGDPDRPIIVGRVYNGENIVPYGLPSKKNISAIRTASTPGGGGFNEIRLDDTLSSEEIFIHAQKDQNEVVRNDHTRSVGNNEHINIVKDQSVHIGRSRRSFVQCNETKVVGLDLSVNVNHDLSLIVDNHILAMGRTVLVEASRTLKLQCNGGYILIDEKGEIHIEGPKVYINCNAENIEQYDEQVRALDDSGKPLADVPYFIETADGRTYAGTTGADGKLPRIRTEGEGSYTVYWFDEALAKMQEGEA